MHYDVNPFAFSCVEEYAYSEYGIIGLNMCEYCYENGFYSYDKITGDSFISAYDLQEACDYLGLDLEVIDF